MGVCASSLEPQSLEATNPPPAVISAATSSSLNTRAVHTAEPSRAPSTNGLLINTNQSLLLSEKIQTAGHDVVEEARADFASAYAGAPLSVTGVPLVTGDFKPEDVQPFARPQKTSTNLSSNFVFFLCHRGPDTKQDLVRPLSFILKELEIPHFFDQNDEAMQLGKVNSDQMAEAAWSSRVGVVVLSDRFAESKWCLRELNTFLLRRHPGAMADEPALLIPVYYASHLMQSKLYHPHCGQLASILRNQNEAAHEFVVSLVPRLLSIPSLQSIPCVAAAALRVSSDPFLIKGLWNKYSGTVAAQTELKMFNEPPGRKELHVIRSMYNTLVPTDIKAGLEVYQPLEYSLSPPVTNTPNAADRFNLDSVVTNLLQNKPVKLGEVVSINGEDEAKNPTGRRKSAVSSSPPSSSPLKVLLIQGAAGSGKSLFGWYLCSRYYEHSKEFKESHAALPLFVSLPVFRSQILLNDASRLLPNYLSQTYGIQSPDALQDQSLVIILDGLDELGFKINLFQACKLHLWRNTTFVITCRNDFLQESDIAQYIVPSNPVTGTAEPNWLGRLYLLPFSVAQRTEYISKFANRYKSVYHWEAQQYLSSLEHVPQLGAFLHEPLLLFMVLSVLPQFHLNHSVSSSSSVLHQSETKLRRLDPYLLEVRPVTEIEWLFPQLRRAELYALFVEGWAEREINRLSAESRPKISQVLGFCSELAFEMFLHSQSSVLVATTRPTKVNVDLLSRAERIKAQRAARAGPIVDTWAINLFETHENERTCSPLRKHDDRFAFLHKSLLEFFAARHMASDLIDGILFEDGPHSWSSFLQSSISELNLSRKRVTSDYAVLRFAADFVDQRVRSYAPSPSNASPLSESKQVDASSFQPYGRALLDILLANRHPIASCNAISILNAAGIGFQARDFTRLDLSSDVFPSKSSASNIARVEEQAAVSPFSTGIALADLTAANLSGCRLSDSNLCGVRLDNACLDYADLRGAAMKEAIFGQSSMFLGHTARILFLVLSRDGLSLFSASQDQIVRQWSTEAGTCVRVLEGHTADVTGLALSRDAKTLFSCSWDATIRQWNAEMGSLVRVFQGHTSQVNVVVLSEDDKMLFSGSSDLTIRIWSVELGSVLRVLTGHTAFISTLALSADGRTLYSGSNDKTIRGWSVETGSVLHVLEGHTALVSSLCVSFDGKTLFSASWDKSIREWSLDTASLVCILASHPQAITALSLSHDGKSVFAGGGDMTIRQWSVDTGSLLRIFQGHTGAVYCLALSPVDGMTMFSGSKDRSIRQWSVDARSLSRVSDGHGDYVNSLVLHSTSKRLYSGAKDRTIREWCVETGSLIRVLEGHTDGVWSLALSSDGKTLYSGCGDSSIGQWSVSSGSLIHRFLGHTDRVLCVALSGDDTLLFSGSCDTTIRAWSVSSRSFIRVFEGHRGSVYSLALSSNNTALFSGSVDGIREWNLATGSLVRALEGHDGAIRALALSSDCHSLYSGSDDTTIRQWAVNSGSLVQVFKAHTALVGVIVLSPDNKKLFSGSDDTTIRVWSVETGTVDCILQGHSRPVLSLALSSNMQSLFSCSGSDRSVREWSLFFANPTSNFSPAQNFSFSHSPSFLPLQVWSSGPWSLSARRCTLNDDTLLAPRSRLLLTQCGETNI